MSQTQAVLNHLKTGEAITPLDALHLFGIFRLSARIKNLREVGYRINTRLVKTPAGKVIAEYRMGEA